MDICTENESANKVHNVGDVDFIGEIYKALEVCYILVKQLQLESGPLGMSAELWDVYCFYKVEDK